MRLQRIPFDRSGIPPGALSLTSASGFRGYAEGSSLGGGRA